MKKLLKVSLPLGFLVAFAGCGGDDGRPTYPSWDKTILELAQEDSDLSTFAELVDFAGLIDSYGGTATVYTVFAPTNAAWNAMGNVAELKKLENKDQLSELLRYHTVGGKQLASLVSLNDNIKTITSTTIVVRTSGNTITLSNSRGDSATLTRTDIQASNGVMHVIDAVMSPPPPPVEPLGTIIDVATDAGGFDSLLAAAAATGLDATLAMAGPYTLLAPTDDAFTALGDISGVDGGVVGNILLSHVLAGSQDSGAITGAGSLTNLAKTSLAVVDGTPVTIGGAALSATVDVAADNGVIHAMDAVIVPPTSVEVAMATADLSMLVTAVTTATLAGALTPDTLAGDAPLTIFAPSNAAFTASGLDVNVASSTLTATLQHHAAAGQMLSGDFSDGDTVTTMNGDLTINVAGDGSVSITDGQGNTANVTTADIRTLTGVVHLIDGVLLP